MCVALLGLSVALGGTTWAATSLPARSVGTAQLKQDAVTGAKVKNHSLTGADVNSTSLGQVPLALRSTSANQAAHALTADSATHATSADTAGTVYSAHFEAGVPLSAMPATIASLQVPAGSYVLNAKAQIDTFNNTDIVGCDLVAGSDKDSSFIQGGSGHQSQIIANSLVQAFAATGTVALICNTFGAGAISKIRVSALTVGRIAGSFTP